MKLFYNPIAYTVTEQTHGDDVPGYHAPNIAIPGVGRSWRNTDYFSSSVANFTFDAIRSVRGIFVHGANLEQVAIQISSSVGPGILNVDVHLYQDRFGRGYGYAEVDIDEVDQGFVSAGTWIWEDETEWRIGAIYFFQDVVNVGPDPDFGMTEVWVKPGVDVQLNNGYRLINPVGPDFYSTDLRFTATETQNPHIVEQILGDKAIGGIAMERSQWAMPVQLFNREYGVNKTGYSTDNITIPVQEVA